MTVRPIATVLVSLAVAWGGCHLARRWAPRWGLVDSPGGRKAHAAPTPLGGGLAIALGTVAGLATPGGFASAAGSRDCLWLTLAAASALLALGLADDRWGIAWPVRLAIEALVAGFVGRSLTTLGGEAGGAEAAVAAGAALWIVVQLNAINMLDNMDALAGGVAAIGAACLAALALWPAGIALSATPAAGDPLAARLLTSPAPAREAVLLPLALGSALLGFLWHNRPPARLFMGDSGSYFVGFLLGAISAAAVIAGDDRAWPARLAPLCVLAVPIYDMVSVVAIRVATGRSPFAADRNHLSHRLVARGLQAPQAVLVIHAAALGVGLTGWVIAWGSPAVGLAALIALATGMILAGLGEFLTRRRPA